MLRLLILLVSMLTTRRPGGTAGPGRLPLRDHDPREPVRGSRTGWEREAREDDPWEDDRWDDDAQEGGRWHPRRCSPQPLERPRRQVIRGQLVRPRAAAGIPRKLAWGAVLVLLALIFRKVIAWAVLAVAVRGPAPGRAQRAPAARHVRLAVAVGHRGDDHQHQRRAPGCCRRSRASPGPRWAPRTSTSCSPTRSRRTSASGRAGTPAPSPPRATPRPRWTSTRDRPGGPRAPATTGYRSCRRPATGVPGRVSVAIVLPLPQLPQSVHDVTVDNTMSHPIDTQHSWTYPGLGCGALIRPQFSVSVLYAQAQNLAFDRPGTTRRSPGR